MSRKNKAFRAWQFQNPNGTVAEAWDAAWANEQGRFASRKHEAQQAKIAELEVELSRLCKALKIAAPNLINVSRMPNMEWVADAHNSAVKDINSLIKGHS